MGRKRTIDRDWVLTVAERIVGERGASALTIDAVANAAGITKGGVQSSFGTRKRSSPQCFDDGCRPMPNVSMLMLATTIALGSGRGARRGYPKRRR